MKNFLIHLTTWFLATILVTMPVTGPGRGDALADAGVDAKWNALQERLEQRFADLSKDMDAKWEAEEKAFAARWEAMNRKILEKWASAERSSRKVWVDYESRLDSRSRVDFENGTIVLETVVEASDPRAYQTARAALEKMGKALFTSTDETGTPVLQDQVATRSGKPVDAQEAPQFLKQEVIPKITKDPKPFTPADGMERQLFRTRFEMVPRHLHVRSKKYRDLVEKHAVANRVDPRLVMAVIHTESYFNPKAVSSAKAIGLMQIIPRFAGRDAYREIYQKDAVMPHDFYFDPENNIQAGCTYLSLLKTRYFSQVTHPMKNRYVAICAYNWGPTAMRNKIVDVYDINAMDEQSVFNLLRQKTPEETKKYILRVTERTPIYAPYFN